MQQPRVSPDQRPATHRISFSTATLDQKQPYVQAADVLTVRLYADQPIFQASLDLPASSDVLVEQIGKDTQSTELRNGRSYQVVERKYLLFPQRSGTLSLDGPVLDAQVQATGSNDPFGNDPAFGNLFGQMPLAGMLNATRPIRLHGKTITLDVLKRPAAATGANWLPAQNVTLQETWRPDTGEIHVGDPVTRHLQLTALGLTGAQLPDLGALMQVPDGIKTYPDQSVAKDAIQGDTVLGTRDQDIALIASRPGRFELPEVKLNWWDTVHDVQHVVTLPARILDILPAAGGSSTATLPPPTVAAPTLPSQGAATGAPIQVHFGQGAGARPWIWLSAALALLWVGTLFGWWYTRRRTQPVQARKDQRTQARRRAQPNQRIQGIQARLFEQRPACRAQKPAGLGRGRVAGQPAGRAERTVAPGRRRRTDRGAQATRPRLLYG